VVLPRGTSRGHLLSAEALHKTHAAQLLVALWRRNAVLVHVRLDVATPKAGVRVAKRPQCAIGADDEAMLLARRDGPPANSRGHKSLDALWEGLPLAHRPVTKPWGSLAALPAVQEDATA